MWQPLIFFISTNFISHGHCYLWKPELIWLHVLSDGLIAIAYYSIPLMLVYFVRKRRDVPFDWMFLLFGSFIVACGTTHLMEIFTLWYPVYWLSGILKALTAFISVLTALLLVPLIPKALALPSPAQLEVSNLALAKEIQEHQRAEAEIRNLNTELEKRVSDRTFTLTQLNQQLRKEMIDRQRTEEVLRLTQFSVDRCADAVFWIGREAQLLYVNDAACRSLGYSPEELLSLTIHDINPDFHQNAWQLHWNVMKRCGSVTLEVHHLTKHNQIFPVEITINHLQFNGKEYQCAFARDITDRKQVENTLREKQKEFQSLVSNIPGAVYRCAFNADRIMMFLSNWIEVISGYSASDFLNHPMRSFTSIIHPSDAVAIQQAIEEAVRVKRPYILEYRLIHYDGTIRWVYEKGQAIFNEEGQVLWLNGAIFDITERKQAEQDLRQSEAIASTRAEQLEVALLELQETQSQLIQTEKLSSLGQMVAGVAHEINNPISFIYGNLTYASQYIKDLFQLIDLYQKHYPTPVSEIHEHLEAIELDFLTEDLLKILSSMKMGADRIREIVLSLRNFSRLDEAEKKPVDIHEGIENTLLILQHRLRGKGEFPEIKIIKEYGQLPLIECYAGQLNQVFMNLLSNAIDALEEKFRNQNDRYAHNSLLLPEHPNLSNQLSSEVTENSHQSTIKKPEIPFPFPFSSLIPTILIHTEIRDGGFLYIRMADNGIGMTNEVHSRLFDPFFTTKPVGKGTGLGLAISYRIVVEKHGGQLRCHSAIAQGSEFVIEIPLNPVAVQRLRIKQQLARKNEGLVI